MHSVPPHLLQEDHGSRAFRLTCWRLCVLTLLTAPCFVAAHPLGQWVWGPRDLGPLHEAEQRRHVVAGVWVGSIGWHDGVTARLGLPPSTRGEGATEVVVRFDDSFHQAWDARPSEQLAKDVEVKLAALLALADGTQQHRSVLQLDYDFPARRLAAWTQLLSSWRQPGHCLFGREVWVTSLLAHLRIADYGHRMHGLVDGHILQLFDTGETIASVEALRDLVVRQELPFRLGLGAFERAHPNGETTHHRDGFRAIPELAKLPSYRGTWVFPAGRSWIHLLEQDP